MKLNHVAIIPDGNRRWARARGLIPTQGHEKGSEVFEKIAKEAVRLKIPYVTAWGCSRDNVLKRSISEVRFNFNLFKRHFERMLKDKDLHTNKVRVRVIGEWPKLFPGSLKNSIEKIETATKNYSKFHLTLLMAYDGRREMADAVNRAKNAKAPITGAKLKQYLWTKDLPPVDLVIRTGEADNLAHWSAGFLMWHTSDSEFYFTKTLWPAFSVAEFKKAVREYEKRPRNLGA